MAAFLLIPVVIVLDQLTKLWVVDSFALHESREVIAGFFNLTYIVNYGAAFGFLNNGGHGPWRTVFFVVVAVAAIVMMLVFLYQLRHRGGCLAYGVSLIAGGAAGNLIDRVRLGFVVDFLDFYVGSYHWPAFNVADSAITVGVGLFLIGNFLTDGTLKS